MVEDGLDGYGEMLQGGGLLFELVVLFVLEVVVLFFVDVVVGCWFYVVGKIVVVEGGVGVGVLIGFEDFDVVGGVEIVWVDE